MRNALCIVSTLCILFACEKSSPPTSEISCAYDGYRTITYLFTGLADKDELYDRNDVLVMYYTFKYDANNNTTSIIAHNPDGSDAGYILLTLNTAGNSNRDIYLDQDSALIGYETNTYDSTDKLISSSLYSADSLLENVYAYYYDGNNRTTTVEKYDAAGSLVEKTTYQRNRDEVLVRVIRCDSNGKQIGYKDYSYGSYSPETNTYSTTITYYDCLDGMAKRMNRFGLHARYIEYVR